MSTNPIQAALVQILQQYPSASNDEIAASIRSSVPGAKTTGASVASMKSRLKKSGGVTLHQPENVDGEGNAIQFTPIQFDLPTFDRYGEANPNETYEEAVERITRRYRALDRMSKRAVNGDIPALIISGPPGLGKSFSVTQALETKIEAVGGMVFNEDTGKEESPFPHEVIRGSISAVGLYIALWNLRDGGVLILDDCDDVFRDETALNLLKAVLDSTPVRRVSWKKRASWLEELGIDDSFDFTGSVIFLTNVDFESAVLKGNREGKHFEALMDRSLYLCLTLRARRDFIIRIRQVADGDDGMLSREFLMTKEQREEILTYIEDNQLKFYTLSLRLVRQIAQCYLADPEDWTNDVETSKMRTT